MSPVKYELDFYIPEDILHSHRRENFKSYKAPIICNARQQLSRSPCELIPLVTQESEVSCVYLSRIVLILPSQKLPNDSFHKNFAASKIGV
jgi:hypothetical protein